jgi:hypothetical protein
MTDIAAKWVICVRTIDEYRLDGNAELANLMPNALATIVGTEARESRGATPTDYATRDDENWRVHTISHVMDGASHTVSSGDPPITDDRRGGINLKPVRPEEVRGVLMSRGIYFCWVFRAFSLPSGAVRTKRRAAQDPTGDVTVSNQ